MKQEDENGGAGNPLDENAGFEDLKQEDENQEPVTLSVKMPVSQDMKQEDENGEAGNPLGENAGF